MSVTEQTQELSADFTSLLGRLQALIDNRSAWADGIEGCRAALEMLKGAAEKARAINEAAGKLEVDLDTAKSESKTWSKNYSELGVVERQLRADVEDLGAELKIIKSKVANLEKRNARLATIEKELRTECEQNRAALDEKGAAMASARSLAKQLEAVIA